MRISTVGAAVAPKFNSNSVPDMFVGRDVGIVIVDPLYKAVPNTYLNPAIELLYAVEPELPLMIKLVSLIPPITELVATKYPFRYAVIVPLVL